MKEDTRATKKGDLVLVQPMKYCISFTEGGLENVSTEEGTAKSTHHWTEDGFKARVLEVLKLETSIQGEKGIIEEYLKVKIFGKGRKHFVKRNGEKTKTVWIQSRLTSPCPKEEKEGNKKKNSK